MPATPIPALLLPMGLIIFGVLMLRDPNSRSALTPANRTLMGRLAILAGVGWFAIGIVRLATGT